MRLQGVHSPRAMILTGVRWHAAYPLGCRHVEELMQERSVSVDHTRDFLLTEPRGEPAATRSLTKALRRHGVPGTVTIDGSAAHAAAMRRGNGVRGTPIISRQVNYVNHVVARGHRAIERATRPVLGFRPVEAAQGALVGIELRQVLKKGQLTVEEGAAILTPAAQFYALAV